MFSSSFLRARIAGILLVLTPGLAGAQGVIDHISPPVVERNKTTRVTFFGRDLAAAIGLWHSLPPEALKVAVIESRPDRAVLNVTASAESPVGLFGVRLATRDGLSNAHILLIDDLPTRPAPSDTDSATLKLPASLWGTFREA